MKTSQSSIRLFENRFLEAITHVHPTIPILFWGPVLGYFFYRSFAVIALPAMYSLMLVAFGIFIWTLAEYVLHRFLFHFESNSAIGKRIVYLFHGIHHDAPNDATRLVMPLVPAVMIGGAAYTLFTSLLGATLVQPFFAGFLLGYLAYDYTHYYVHFANPKTRVGKYLKQHHMLHHFAANEAKWGVSSPFWDVIFGTLGKKQSSS
jgi:dihydroceramide fatty acyl 2-hydroxylase